MKEIRTQDPFSIYRYDLLTDTTSSSATSIVETVSPQLAYRTFFASLSSGTAASVDIEVSGNGVTFKKFVTLTVTNTTPDGFADICPWPYVRAVVTSNNGTLSVTMGC